MTRHSGTKHATQKARRAMDAGSIAGEPGLLPGVAGPSGASAAVGAKRSRTGAAAGSQEPAVRRRSDSGAATARRPPPQRTNSAGAAGPSSAPAAAIEVFDEDSSEGGEVLRAGLSLGLSSSSGGELSCGEFDERLEAAAVEAKAERVKIKEKLDELGLNPVISPGILDKPLGVSSTASLTEFSRMPMRRETPLLGSERSEPVDVPALMAQILQDSEY